MFGRGDQPGPAQFLDRTVDRRLLLIFNSALQQRVCNPDCTCRLRG